MLSVSVTINRKGWLLSLFFSVVALSTFAQENSPYSRYGLGDMVPNQSIISRGMGGIAAGFNDYDRRYDLRNIYPRPQSVNFLNPASYARLRITSFDLGFEIDSRTLRSSTQGRKFSSASAIISYLQLGIPLNRKQNLGMNFGLRPVTRINYKVETRSRDVNANNGNKIDSLQTLYEGSGGTYEVYVGLAKGFKNLSIGFNTGYFFGTKDYSTRKNYIPDSAEVMYYSSNHQNKTNFGGLFFKLGVQYSALLDKKTTLTVGGYGNLKRKFNANNDYTVETFSYDAAGGTQRIDSVYEQKGLSGKLEYPSSFGAGFTITRDDSWMVGVDYSTTKWSEYRLFNQADSVRDEWVLRVGGQFTPNPFSQKNYWGRVTYRLGFFYGPDYIYNRGQSLNRFGVTAGAAFPVRKNPYTNQYSQINLGLEYGRRGNTSNVLRENLFRVALGFTLSDLWFVKRKYD